MGLQFLIFNFALLTLQTCGLDIEDPTPPSPPEWVQKSLPEEWPERGIDASESGSIQLEWHASQESDIAGYHLHRARYYHEIDSLGAMEDIKFITGDLDAITYIDESAEGLVYYRFAMTTEDEAGNQSLPTDTIGYRLLQHVLVETMVPNGLTQVLALSRQLSWVYRYYEEMQDYVITVLTLEGNLVIRQLFEPGNYIGYIETWQIPDEFHLIDGQQYKWRIDTGASYRDGNETQGSESDWAYFSYEE